MEKGWMKLNDNYRCDQELTIYNSGLAVEEGNFCVQCESESEINEQIPSLID